MVEGQVMQKDVTQIPEDPRANANADWENVKDRHFWRQFPRYMILKDYLEGSVLDVGGGPGFLAPFCLPNASVYTCVDISDVAVKHGAMLFPGSTFICQDVEKTRLPFGDKSFDTVVCSEVFEHIETHDFLLAELKRVARRRIIITVPTSMGGVGHIWPVWSYAELVDKFGCLGKIMEIRCCFAYHFHLVWVQP